MNPGAPPRHLSALCLGVSLLLLPATSPAADHVVSISGNSFVPDELTVAVGDTVTFRNPSGGLHNAVSDPGAANTFRCANGCDATGGNGAPSAANWTGTVTMSNPGFTPYYCDIHGGPGGAGMSGLITVTGTASVPPAPVADLVRLHVGDGPTDIDVLANDLDLEAIGGGSLSIVQAPGQGVATVVDGGNPATPADDVVRYTLPGGVAVDTTLRYRLCNGGGGCTDAGVRILARALVDDDLMIDSAGDAGFVDVALANLPALPEARLETTVLVRPGGTGFFVSPDTASPENPWDNVSNRQTRTETITGVVGTEFALVADVTTTAGNVTLYIGRDLDGDSSPDPAEILCTSAMSPTMERCEARITHPGTNVVWWATVHNPFGTTATASVRMAHIPVVPAAAGLAMTGPGHLPAGATSAARLGWHVPGMEEGESRYALARVRPTPSSDLGWTPVRIDRIAGGHAGLALVSGVDQTVELIPGNAHERMYIDVPEGATLLTATVTGGDDYELYLSRHATLTHPGIQAAPPRDQAVASGTGPGDESLQIAPPVLVPGRWYVTPVAAGAFSAPAVVRATVAATPPAVRSGSYFNPDRSGHGLFLYPAGGGTVWTVLWYHYFEDGSPTWYYLEAAAPGSNGIWSSGIYRSAWDGDSNHLTRVGEATLTPSGPDEFTWSWTLDGRSGSEPLAALGRGCPTVDSIERDSSSTWFDPATAGTGYSVQLFPNGYEYNAAFVYDGHGRPRYLAAELPLPGAAVTTYDLEQLTGFCPLCARTGAPAREAIGTYTRTYAGGKLTRIEVDAIYADGIPGAWTGDDTVQPLGGAETVQGCEL